MLLHVGNDASQPANFIDQFEYNAVHQRPSLPGPTLDALQPLLCQAPRMHIYEHMFD